MKSVCVFLLALSGASAFAPAQTARTATQLAATEELTGMRGTGIESGNKIVSSVVCSIRAVAGTTRTGSTVFGLVGIQYDIHLYF